VNRKQAIVPELAEVEKALQIIWSETGPLGEPSGHLWSYFDVVVERKDDVFPVRATQRSVRARLALHDPTDLQHGGQNAPRLVDGQLLKRPET